MGVLRLQVLYNTFHDGGTAHEAAQQNAGWPHNVPVSAGGCMRDIHVPHAAIPVA